MALVFRPRSPWAQRVLVVALQVGLLASVVGLWQWAANERWIDPLFFSKPSEIWRDLHRLAISGQLISNVLPTLKVLGLGWGLGLALGTAIGFLIGISRIARDFLEPFLVFANAFPRLLLLPFFVVWLGFGIAPKVLLVVVVIFVVVALMVASGIGEVSKDLIRNVRALGAGRWHLLRAVYIPSTLLWLFASSRSTLGFAFQATVVAELYGIATGLGSLLTQAQILQDGSQMWAVLAVTMAIGLIIDTSLGFIEARLTRWLPK